MEGIPKSYSARRPEHAPKPEKRRAHNSTLAAPTKPMAKVNPERAAQARAEDFGWQASACERLPCYACGRQGASVAHHDPPRARGGTDADTVPLCDRTRLNGVPGCHQRRHDVGELTFWAELGVTPEQAIEHVRIQAGLLPPETP